MNFIKRKLFRHKRRKLFFDAVEEHIKTEGDIYGKYSYGKIVSL